MAHCNTILSQILKLVPRHEFETLANRHHSNGMDSSSLYGIYVCQTEYFLTTVTSRGEVRDEAYSNWC